jgi:HAD superfamily hydrolase (TIGR01509 family)
LTAKKAPCYLVIGTYNKCSKNRNLMIEDSRDRSLKLVMLDCDGVLFDSFRSNVAYYNAILEKLGEQPLDEETAGLCHVYSTPQLFSHLYPDDPERAREAERIAYSIDYRPFLEYMDPVPGLYEVLGALKASYQVALATNRGKSIPPLLERFDLREAFDVVSTILDVPQPKPAPDLLLYCLEKTGLAAEQSVYVGDMENDRIAAEAAGIPFVLMGNSIPHPLRIDRLAELPGLLQRTYRGQGSGIRGQA